VAGRGGNKVVVVVLGSGSGGGLGGELSEMVGPMDREVRWCSRSVAWE
jgi:hypothetical protein